MTRETRLFLVQRVRLSQVYRASTEDDQAPPSLLQEEALLPLGFLFEFALKCETSALTLVIKKQIIMKCRIKNR